MAWRGGSSRQNRSTWSGGGAQNGVPGASQCGLTRGSKQTRLVGSRRSCRIGARRSTTGDSAADSATENNSATASAPRAPKSAYVEGSGPSLSADFTFVARDAVTNTSAAVNPLVPDCDASRALFAATGARAARKKAASRERLREGVSAPSDLDASRASALAAAKAAFVDAAARETRAALELPALAAPDAILSDATRTENMFVAQPQQRNLSGRVFGGFLLRRAFELAFATTYVFGGARPRFRSVRDMDFLKPVDVGDPADSLGDDNGTLRRR